MSLIKSYLIKFLGIEKSFIGLQILAKGNRDTQQGTVVPMLYLCATWWSYLFQLFWQHVERRPVGRVQAPAPHHDVVDRRRTEPRFRKSMSSMQVKLEIGALVVICNINNGLFPREICHINAIFTHL